MELMKQENQLAFSEEDVKKYICKNATDEEFKFFIELCKARDLNPFLREVYFIKFGKDAQIVVGKDGILKRARRNPSYNGFKAGYFNDKGQEFEHPIANIIGAWCEVYIDGQQPIKSVALLSEYDTGQSLWKTKKMTMIRKVAVAQAHREAFPEDTSGMYEKEEMDMALEESYSKNPIVVNPIQKLPEEKVNEVYDYLLKGLKSSKNISELELYWGDYNKARKDLSEDQQAEIELTKDARKNELIIAQEEEYAEKRKQRA